MILLPSQPDLKPGSSGPEVGNWQRFLNGHGFRDSAGHELVVDEAFGTRTGYATAMFQKRYSLLQNAIVGRTTRAAAVPMGFVEFVQAKHFSQFWPKTDRKISLITIHTMECLETPDAAANVALWFAGKTAYEAPQASAHYCLEPDATFQCVRLSDVAWHAKQANGRSIGIEHAGYAKQSAADWADDYSTKLLARSARLVARLCRTYGIPIRRLTPDEIRSGLAGICGHIDVTNAYDAGVGHTDPGQGFVWDAYLDLVSSL